MAKRLMKADHFDPAQTEFPVIASPKIDGYRCGVDEGADGN